MFRLRPFCAPISVICLMLVVPEVDTTVGGDEMGNGEGDLLLPLEIVGGRAAFEVDGAVRHQRDAGRRGDRVELDVELRKLELALHPLDDAPAEIHGVAHHLLLVVVVGERHRGLAVAERNRAGVLDLLERAGDLLCEHRGGGEARRRNHRKQHLDAHRCSPL
jgi:hypothetical protein